MVGTPGACHEWTGVVQEGMGGQESVQHTVQHLWGGTIDGDVEPVVADLSLDKQMLQGMLSKKV